MPPVYPPTFLGPALLTAPASAFPVAGYADSPASPPPVPVASLGRLCRELAAVRARALPALVDAYTTQARARTAAADPYFSGRIVPAPADVGAWVAACIAHAAADARDSVHREDPDVVGTLPLRDGLQLAGYSPSKDALAVLRSAFRVRPEYAAEGLPFPPGPSLNVARAWSAAVVAGGAGAAPHAAIAVYAVATFLTCEEPAAHAMLLRLDDYARARSGSARPGPAGASVPPTPSHGRGPAPHSLPATGAYGASPFASAHGRYAHPPPVMPPASALGTPARPAPAYAPAPSMPSTPAVAAAMGLGLPVPSLPASVASTPAGGSHGAGRGASRGAAGALAAGLPAAAPPTGTVADYLASGAATPQEREAMHSFLAALAAFEARMGLPPSKPGSGEGSDALVLPLGPNLKVGIRFYV